MTQQVINIGTTANDGSGDPLRTAFNKINSNFTEIYSKGASGSNLDISENEIAATNSNGNIELVPSGSGRVSIVDDTLTITTSRTPASIGSDGDVAGMIAWDSTNLYVSTADYDGSTTIWNTLSTGSATDLILSTDTSNSLTSTSNGNINIAPNGTGDINLIADTVVVGDSNTQTIVTTNGTGNLLLTTNFNSNSGNIVIVQGANGNINITPNGTGQIVSSSVVNATRFVSNIAIGTAPFTVTSTTQVANLNVATAGTAGTVTTAAQPNITSVGILDLLDVDNININGNTISSSNTNGNIDISPNGTGNINLNDSVQATSTIQATRFISNIAIGTAPFTVTSTTQVANLNVATAGTVTTAAQPNITSVGTLTSVTIAAGTTSVSPINLTSGTNLTTAAAGAVEFDGTTLNFTPNTNYGRAAIPATVYTSGVGTSLTPTATGEATAQALFPAAGDTITLPIGTYHITLVATITRGATSVTSATARINFGGGGGAAGSFTGTAVSSVAAAGATSQFMFNGVALTVDNVVSAANAVAAGVYNTMITGILRITTAGTFIPKYSLSANLAGATTATAPSALNYLMIQSVGTSGTAAATGGWA